MLKLNRKHFLTALCLAPALSWAQSSNTVVMYTSAPTEIQNALVPAIKAKLGLMFSWSLQAVASCSSACALKAPDHWLTW